MFVLVSSWIVELCKEREKNQDGGRQCIEEEKSSSFWPRGAEVVSSAQKGVRRVDTREIQA